MYLLVLFLIVNNQRMIRNYLKKDNFCRFLEIRVNTYN